MKEQIVNLRREMTNLWKNQKTKLETKTLKNDSDGLISRLHMPKERIRDFEDMSVKISQTERQKRKKNEKTSNGIFKKYGTIMKSNICNGTTKRRGKREKRRRNICSDNGWVFPGTNDRYQTTVPGKSGNTKKDKYQKIYF